jgi:diaminohydroxyphosphoribosylaminopyrimidine deaminase/5-amino-6-(5-phosphoribosylamino)uracil reductase
MVGTKTALVDQPLLSNRYWFGAQPVKILLDAELTIPETSPVFSGGQVLIFNQRRSGREGNRTYVQVKGKPLALPEILDQLYSLGIASVLVEGGSLLLQSFIDAGYWDEARVITNTELVLENGYPAPVLTAGIKTDSQTLQHNEVAIYHHTH